MSAPHAVSIHSKSPEATERIASHLADVLGPGDTLCLVGDLGAGKSLFARAIIRALTGETDIPSPTYTLVQTYQAAEFTIWHTDLYRLSDPDEVAEIGLEDAFDTALCLIEWPDRLAYLPNGALWIELANEGSDDHRQIRFKAGSDRWAECLAALEGNRVTAND
ncbi:MAG: tRNA (adenosine(37)-N6)-threonylcarbamoyltransferase complex ATPase subunit type 1 TsaE [Pseudomonadota bacterium]